MYIRNAWYAAGFWDMLDETGMLSIDILGEPVVVYRRSDGALVALEGRCPHRMASLGLGRIEGDHLRCMYHGIRFNEEGKAVEIPGQDIIPARMCLRKYAVEERSGWIWVWMGDAEKADTDLIPPLYGLKNPDWRQPKNYLDYAVDYRLLNDNLTDLSHVSFVHAQSFGADTTFADTRPTSYELDRGVRYERWLRKIPPIPPLGEAANHEFVDQWLTVDYLVPGIFILYSENHVLGTADACNGEAPKDRKALFRHYSQQCVTPTGPRSLRYFFAWGPSADCSTPDEGELMGQILQRAFYEDKEMIEAQQKIIDSDPSRAVIPTSVDQSVLIFQRLMDRMIKEEQKDATTQAA